MTIQGVRFVNSNHEVFFIYLTCFNSFHDYGGSFHTTDCIVDKIENANTKEEIEAVTGKGIMSKAITYKTGERITGTKTYFCKCIQALFDMHYLENRNGYICCDNLTVFRRLKHILTSPIDEINK